MLRRLLREPLLHFLLLGGRALRSSSAAAAPRTTRRRPADRRDARPTSTAWPRAFARTWHARPTPEELQAQIDDYIREEVLYRAGARARPRQGRHHRPAPPAAEDGVLVRGHGRRAAGGRAARLFRRPSGQVPHRAADLVPPGLRQLAAGATRRRPTRGRCSLRLVAPGPVPQDEGDPSLLGDDFEPDAAEPRSPRSSATTSPASWPTPRPGAGRARCASAYGYHLVLVTARRAGAAAAVRAGARGGGARVVSPSAAPRRRTTVSRAAAPATRCVVQDAPAARHESARPVGCGPAAGVAAGGAGAARARGAPGLSWSCARPPRACS